MFSRHIYTGKFGCSKYLFVLYQWIQEKLAGHSQRVSFSAWELSAVWTLKKFKARLFDQVKTIKSRSFSIIVRSKPFVHTLESASADWFLINPSWKISKSHSINQSLYCANLPVLPSMFTIQNRSRWSARNVNPIPSIHGRSNRIAQSTARKSRYVVSSFILFGDGWWQIFDRWGVFPSSPFCRRTHPTSLSHVSLSEVLCPFFLARRVLTVVYGFRLRYKKPGALLLQGVLGFWLCF